LHGMSGWEVAGAALGVAGLVLPIVSATDLVGKRHWNFHKNKKVIDDLLAGLTPLRARLQDVRKQLTSPRCQIPATNAQSLAQSLTDAETFFDNADTELKEFRALSWACRATRATRIAAGYV
jgi:hypothetical protein